MAGGRWAEGQWRPQFTIQLRDDVIDDASSVADHGSTPIWRRTDIRRVDHRTLKEAGIERSPERRISAFRIEKMSSRERAEYVRLARRLVAINRTVTQRD